MSETLARCYNCRILFLRGKPSRNPENKARTEMKKKRIEKSRQKKAEFSVTGQASPPHRSTFI